MNNTMTEMKNTLVQINRITEAEEWISNLEERIVEITAAIWASLVAHLVKNLPAMRETWVRSLGWEDPLEKEKAPHSSILAWRILQRVRHDRATFTNNVLYELSV